MTQSVKFDRIITGVISGIMLPIVVAFFIFLFSKGDPSLSQWLNRISITGVETQIITLCVFPNVVIFFLFNHFDMLRATRGVLGVTIAWAAVMLIVRLFS